MAEIVSSSSILYNSASNRQDSFNFVQPFVANLFQQSDEWVAFQLKDEHQIK